MRPFMLDTERLPLLDDEDARVDGDILRVDDDSEISMPAGVVLTVPRFMDAD